MWYKKLKGTWPQFFKDKLDNEKSFVDLGSLFAAVDVSSLLEEGKLLEAREKTLAYLHKLLEDDIVKVGQYIGGDGTADEYLGTPDEIIERIRTEWNNTEYGALNNDSTIFEASIHIVLKENLWPVWR